MRRVSGFTLIELMITVAIIGIVAAVAYPSYQDFMRRGIRSQGQQLLMDIGQRQEQYFLDQRQFATGLGVGAGLLNIAIPREVSDKYQAPVFNVNNGATPPTWNIVLTPIAGGMMVADGVLILNNLQQRWREVVGGDGAFGANDCRWEDSRCTPSS